jgi:hypothetical protein
MKRFMTFSFVFLHLLILHTLPIAVVLHHILLTPLHDVLVVMIVTICRPTLPDHFYAAMFAVTTKDGKSEAIVKGDIIPYGKVIVPATMKPPSFLILFVSYS